MTDPTDINEDNAYIDQWEHRSRVLAHRILDHIANQPVELVIDGKSFRVEVRKYDRGPDVEPAPYGMVLVSGHREHIDFSFSLTGWGTVQGDE